MSAQYAVQVSFHFKNLPIQHDVISKGAYMNIFIMNVHVRSYSGARCLIFYLNICANNKSPGGTAQICSLRLHC